MKLFTKDIDKKLFAQYETGSELDNQVVVAKIFNPYGRGTWYIINSDPSDPDYLWAIVDLFEVEVGSVSRSELENIKVPPFRLGLERDMYFEPVNAAQLLEGLMSGERYKDGGQIDIAEQNKEMLINYAEELEKNTEEFEETAKKAENVEPWVVAKIERSTTDLSDVTNYLHSENEKRREYGDGEGEEMAKGGRLMGKGDAVIYDNETHFITEKNGVVGLVNMKQSASGSNFPFTPLSKIDVSKEVTDMYGEKVKIPTKFESGGMTDGENSVDKHRIYFSSFAEVMDAINDIADENGYKIVDIFPDLSYGGVSYGQTRKAKVELEWNGKEKVGKSKKREKNSMNVQIYRMESGNYELNTYFSYEKGGIMAKGGEVAKVGEPYDSMTKYQLEKEYKKLNEKRDTLKNKYGSFDSQEISENEKEIEKIITLLYGEDFSGKGQKFKYAKGGVTFADKVKSVKSSLLKRKKVSPKVQKDYGKTYSPAEAEDSAKRIVGAMTAKERLIKRMKKGKK
jgi:hypothetical protein